ncbi:MAG: NUDIX domain-containing protein [Candidatus Moranbacteria bacterium]|nr:NUDIX domain-containing protein [Candidatus Moranbacteria bacterium]
MIAFEKSAGIIVFRKEKDKIFFLLLKYVNGHWDFPKGHIEERETAKQAALRELQEETEIQEARFMDGFQRNIYYFFRAQGNERREREKAGQKINILKKVSFFLGEVQETKVVVSLRQNDYAWLPFEEAVKKATHRNAKRLLKYAHRHLKNKKD